MNVFINKMNFIGKKYTFATYAENFKKSGDILMDNHQEKVALYLYRHFIELSLKFLSQKIGIKIKEIHNLKLLKDSLFQKLEKQFGMDQIQLEKMEKIILKYVELDPTGTFIRYPFDKKTEKENLIENNLLATINIEEEKNMVNDYLEIFYEICDVLDMYEYHQEEMQRLYENYF